MHNIGCSSRWLCKLRPTWFGMEAAWLSAVLSESMEAPCDDFANHNHMMMPHTFVLTTLWFHSIIEGIYMIVIDNVLLQWQIYRFISFCSYMPTENRFSKMSERENEGWAFLKNLLHMWFWLAGLWRLKGVGTVWFGLVLAILLFLRPMSMWTHPPEFLVLTGIHIGGAKTSSSSPNVLENRA